MRIHLLTVLFFFIAPLAAFAQHEADNWYFGDHAGIAFKNGTVTSINDGQLNTREGCATVSDKTTGALLFYTDGVWVWNKNHQIMTNGFGLRGGSSSTQSALIVPNPANSLQYYIFTVPDLSSGTVYHSAAYYSIVSLETPGGEVISKNNFLIDNVAEKLTGTYDCSSNTYWVVMHLRLGKTFYSFHVTASGVNLTPVVSNYTGNLDGFSVGCMKISPNTTKLAVATENGLALFGFDVVSGSVNNYMHLSYRKQGYYGVSFSPDNSKLYATADHLYQYEVDLQTEVAIKNSVSIINGVNEVYFGALQLGPDGKIYRANYTTNVLGVIDKPNLKGNKCNYKPSSIFLSDISTLGLPNFMDYNMGYSSDTVTICKDNGLQIGVSPQANYSYTWTPSAGLSNPNIANPIASPSHSTQYILKIRSNTGCESASSYFVRIESATAAAEQVPPICAGSSVKLNASGGDSYSWSPTTDLNSSTIPNPIVKPKVSTNYKVIVTKGVCIDSAFVYIEVIDLPKANAGEDKTLCLYESVQIGDTAKPDETYLWYPPNGLDNTAIPNPTATPMGTTRYIVAVTKNGCTAYDTVLVTVALVKPAITEDVTICKGSSVQLTASGGKAYSWSPSKGLSNPRIQNPIASPSVTTKYRVLISSGKCIDSAFVTVTVTPAPSANAGADKAICLGSSTEIGTAPEPEITYSWSPATYLDNPSKANPTSSPDKTTLYILTITNSSGCKAYDTVVVSIKNIQANAGADKTVCTDASTQIGASPETGFKYSWLPEDNLNNPTIANPTVTPKSTTRYILTVTDKEGCIGYDTVLVAVSNTLTANVSRDTAICKGSTIQLLASGGSEYLWSPVDGLDNPTIPNPIAKPDATTTYTVRVSSGKCEDSAKVTITVHPFPIADAGRDQSSCMGETTKLGAPPLEGYSYQWQPPEGLNNPAISNPTATPLETTEYILTVTNSSGCTARDTVLVTIRTTNAVASADTSICNGSSVKLFASGGSDYQWSPATGLDNPTIATPTASPNSTIQYEVIVSNGSCKDTAFVTVNVIDPPIADAGRDTSICVDESALIGNQPITGNSYSWNPIDGLNNPFQANPNASPKQTTQYILTVSNQYGCVDYDTVLVTVTPLAERLFTLTPPTISITPGLPFQTSLHIPSNSPSWVATLDYDSLVVKFSSILEKTTGIILDKPIEKNGQLILRGTGGDGDVVMKFDAFLPTNQDTVFPMVLKANYVDINNCVSISTQGSSLVLNEFCGMKIRMVSSTGKNYFLINKENGIHFGVGLPGRVKLELYDYLGTLKEVIAEDTFEAGEYSIDLNVPAGMYFCRITSGMFESVKKVIILR